MYIKSNNIVTEKTSFLHQYEFHVLSLAILTFFFIEVLLKKYQIWNTVKYCLVTSFQEIYSFIPFQICLNKSRKLYNEVIYYSF